MSGNTSVPNQLVIVAFLVCTLSLSGCVSPAGQDDIVVEFFEFNPDSYVTEVGEPVVFGSILSMVHTIDFVESFAFENEQAFRDALTADVPGVSVSHAVIGGDIDDERRTLIVTFDQPGVYRYICQEHMWIEQWVPPPSRDEPYSEPENFTVGGMVGTITVVA